MRSVTRFIVAVAIAACSAKSESVSQGALGTRTRQATDSCVPPGGAPAFVEELYHQYSPFESVSWNEIYTAPVDVFTPDAVPVTAGQAGNHSFTLTWSTESVGGDGPPPAFKAGVPTTTWDSATNGICVYRGAGTLPRSTSCHDNGSEYRLYFCTTTAAFLVHGCARDPDACAQHPEVLGATQVPRGGLLRDVTYLKVEGFSGDPCATTRARLTMISPPTNGEGLPTCGDHAAPSWPAGSVASAIRTGPETAAVMWTAAVDDVGVAGYRLYLDGQLIRELDPSTLTATVAGLVPEAAHEFRVQAFDAAGNVSSDGPIASIRLDGLAPTWPAGGTLAATRVGESSAILVWTAATDNVGVTMYRVYRDGVVAVEVGSNSLVTTLTDLPTDVALTFSVQALDADGNESQNGPSARLLLDASAPTWPTASTLSVNVIGPAVATVHIEWTTATDNVEVTAYRVYADESRIAESTGYSTTVTQLPTDRNLRLSVQAIDGAGNESTDGPNATILIDHTPPSWPTGSALTASVEPSGATTISWTEATDNVGVTAYELYRDGEIVEEVLWPRQSTTVTTYHSDTTFQIQARDAAGNKSVDGPSTRINAPDDRPVWPADAVIRVHAIARDGAVLLSWDEIPPPSPPVARYEVVIDETTRQIVANTGPIVRIENLALGMHIFEVTAIGMNGGRSTVLSAQTTLELNAPTWPTDATISAGPSGLLNIMEVTFTAALDDIGIRSYTVFSNGRPATEVTAPPAYIFVPDIGANLTIRATDTSDNLSEPGPSITALKDTSKPYWPQGSSLLVAPVSPGRIRVQWPTANDSSWPAPPSVGGVARYRVLVNGALAGTAESNVRSLEVPDLRDDADYVVQVTAIDRWGNLSTGDPTISVPRDTDAPAWPAGAALRSAQIAPNAVRLEWTAATDDLGVAAYRVFADGSVIQDVAGADLQATVRALPLRDSATFVIQAVDARGHATIGPSSVLMFDNEAPTWAGTSRVTATVYDRTASLTWTEASDDRGVERYLVYADGLPVRATSRNDRTAVLTLLAPNTSYVVRIEAQDAVRNTSADGPTATFVTADVAPLPPLDPPPLDRTLVTTLHGSSSFLYTGERPVQRAVPPGAIEKERAALVRGRVVSRTGTPLSNVTVSVLHHPELGSTETRLDGEFALVVNGGTPLTLSYYHPSYFTVQRTVAPPWKGAHWAGEVVLLPPAAEVTEVQSEASYVQVVQSAVVEDDDGERRATLLFPAGVSATMEMPDGNDIPLASIHVRATEYTVGPQGPRAMPGPLPPTSAYTYALELTADEVRQAGASTVRFDKPIALYVDNFLGFRTGTAAPLGYYDFERAAWVAAETGRVVEVVGVSFGVALLDVNGDQTPETEEELLDLGVSQEELGALASVAIPGQTFWRVAIDHFTPYDINWAWVYPADAEAPEGVPEVVQLRVDDPCEASGSIIACEHRALGEVVPIAGTAVGMRYDSDRTAAFSADRVIRIPITNDEVPPSLQRARVSVEVAGQHFERTFAPLPRQTFEYEWDGKDAWGRVVQGRTAARVAISYTYPVQYAGTARFGDRATGSGLGVTRVAGSEIELATETSVLLGSYDNTPQNSLGGWSLTNHAAADLSTGLVYVGDGRVFHTGGARSRYVLDLATIDRNRKWVHRIVPDGAGGIFVLMSTGECVWYIDPEGNHTPFAGVCGLYPGGFEGDGGPATEALFNSITGMVLDPDGSLYILDAGNGRIRRVDASGIVTTVAGVGVNAYFGDGGRAEDAGITSASWELLRGPDGSLYFCDAPRNLIRRITTDGLINRYVTEVNCHGGLPGASFMSMDQRGTIYLADPYFGLIRRVLPNGRGPFVVAGNAVDPGEPNQYPAPSGSGARDTKLSPWTVAAADDGMLYFVEFCIAYDCKSSRVRRIEGGKIVDVADSNLRDYAGTTEQVRTSGLDYPVLGSPQPYAAQTIALAVGNGNTLYIGSTSGIAAVRLEDTVDWADQLAVTPDGAWRLEFDADGRHVATKDPMTGEVATRFEYDTSGRVIAMTDADANRVRVDYPSQDEIRITAPGGQQTQLSLDSEGHLVEIADAAGEVTQLEYERGDLLSRYESASEGTAEFEYDDHGLLVSEASPAGTQTFSSELAGDSAVVRQTQASGRTATYETANLVGGGQRRRMAGPDGQVTEVSQFPDGRQITTYPDGSSLQLTKSRDPMFGVSALNTTRAEFSTPSGKLLATDIATSYGFVAGPGSALRSMDQLITANGRTSKRQYDAVNRIGTVISPAGRVAQTQYDERGRPLVVTLPGLLPILYTYDSAGRITSVVQGERVRSYTYDAAGDLVAMKGPGEAIARTTYDRVGRPVTMTRPDEQAVGVTYELGGNRVRVSLPQGATHLLEEIPEARMSRYSPPAVGSISADRVTRLDEDGLVRTSTFGDGDGAATIAISRDVAGRPRLVRTSRGEFAYSYTLDGQLRSEATPEDETTTFEYDGPLLTALRHVGVASYSVVHEFDAHFELMLERVNESAIQLSRDADGLLSAVGELAIERNATSGFVDAAMLRKTGWRWARNGYGDIHAQAASYDGSYFWLSSTLARDPAGRVLSRQDVTGARALTQEYEYDSLGRLTAVRLDGVEDERYAYDANGNRTAARRAAGTNIASFDAQDRLVSDGVFEYTYTGDGALAARIELDSGRVTTYGYDLAGDLHSVVLSSGAQIDYTLNGRGQRVSRSVEGEVTHRWAYGVGPAPLAELDRDGRITTRFVYGERAWVPAYMVRGGRAYAIIGDERGSVRFVVDADSGVIAQKLEYDAFGVVTLDTNPGFQPFGFAGGLYDEATGLVRLGARDYDPYTGRFVSKDPLLFGGGDTNLYAYAGNDPINRSDPSGLSVGSVLSDLWLGASISLSNIWNGNEDPLADALAGFGDTVTFGLGAKIRGAAGLSSFIDDCSDEYRHGARVGRAYNTLTTVASLGTAAVSAGKLVGAALVARGRAAVALAKHDLSRRATILGEEITVRVPGWPIRTRIDLLVKFHKSGIRAFVEVKAGLFARLTINQRILFPIIRGNGGIGVGKNAAAAGIAGSFDGMPIVILHYP